MADEKDRGTAIDQVDALRNNDSTGTEGSCSFSDLTCKATDAADAVADGYMDKLTLGAEGFIEMMFTGPLQLNTISSFMSFPLIEEALGYLTQYGILFAIIIFAGCMIFNQSSGFFKKWGAYAFRVVIVTGGATWIGTMLIQASDDYSKWIIDQATPNQEMGRTIIDALNVTGAAGGVMSLIVLLIVAFFTLIQGVLLMVRFITLPILMLFAPVVISMSFTRLGMSWWNHLLTYWIALLLFKPVVATIYAAGFEAIGAGNMFASQGFAEAALAGLNMFFGVALVGIATFALGWMFKVAAPIVGQVEATVSGGAMTAAGVSTAATLATGAVGRAIGGVTASGLSTGSTVTPLNAAAKADTGSTGTPAHTGSTGYSRPSSGWDHNLGSPGSTGTSTGGTTGATGPQGPSGTGAVGTPSTSRTHAATGAVGTPSTKGGTTQGK